MHGATGSINYRFDDLVPSLNLHSSGFTTVSSNIELLRVVKIKPEGAIEFLSNDSTISIFFLGVEEIHVAKRLHRVLSMLYLALTMMAKFVSTPAPFPAQAPKSRDP